MVVVVRSDQTVGTQSVGLQSYLLDRVPPPVMLPNISPQPPQQTIQYIAPGAFNGCRVGQIFVDGDAAFWDVIDASVDFPGAKVYFKHTEEYVTIVDENGKTVTVKTSSVNDTYWYKSGSEYIIWGCRHVFGEYVDDNNATCTQNGTKTAHCTLCDGTHTVEIADSMLPHKYDETSHICTADGCDAKDPSVN